MNKINKTVIFMGYSCNNKCIFCCNSNRRKNIKDQTTSTIKKQILIAKKEGSSYLELVGGEPTMRKDIFNIVRFAKSLNFKTIMFATNGRMFYNKKFAKNIVDAGINLIIFSIHGHNPKLHDQLTQVPNSFFELKKGIENLKENGFNNIGSNTTIVKQNYKYLKEIGLFIYNLGIKNSEFIFVDPTRGVPKERFDELVPTYEEVSPYVNNLLKFGKYKKISHWNIRYYPLCFIKKEFHNMVSEIHEKKVFQTEHIAPDFINKNVTQNRAIIGRVKLPKCQECEYNNLCEGYWKEYVNQRPGNE